MPRRLAIAGLAAVAAVLVNLVLMTLPADFDAASKVTLALCHLALVPITVFAVRAMAGFAVRAMAGFAVRAMAGFAVRAMAGFAVRAMGGEPRSLVVQDLGDGRSGG